ncbi:MAG: helix-turn-helix transcriptional regulator [Solirubrobacterales bacterium]|nr:helix-turn-helix transcriptional regulator [Solirubrobacterales bacterium]
MEFDSLTARISRVVRERRRQTGDTLSQVAARAGLSKTILSRIENGHGNPSIDTLFRLARALELPLSALLVEDEPPRARRIPARSGSELHADSGMTAWLVHARGRGADAEVYELSLAAGIEQRTPGHLPGTEELVFCLRGRLRVGPVGEEVELAGGDAAWFAADGEHRYLALRAARALNWILSPARA